MAHVQKFFDVGEFYQFPWTVRTQNNGEVKNENITVYIQQKMAIVLWFGIFKCGPSTVVSCIGLDLLTVAPLGQI